MSNVIDGPTPHRVPCKQAFDRLPECACDPGTGMSRAEMLARIAELEGIIYRHIALNDVDTPDDRAVVEAIVQAFRKSKQR